MVARTRGWAGVPYGSVASWREPVFEVLRHSVMRRWFARPFMSKQWRWRLRAGNGEIIAVSSESYMNKDDCLRSIDIVRMAAREAGLRFE